MQKNLKGLLTSITLIALLTPSAIFIENYFYEKGQKGKSFPFGNVMSEYFYYINTGNGNNLAEDHKFDPNRISDPELAAFYKQLNWQANSHLIVNFSSEGDSTWHSVQHKGNKPNFLTYWQSLRAQIAGFYNMHLPRVSIDIPVVHFRCSDVPFVKHEQYHLTKRGTVEWMAQQVKQRGYNQVILLSCNTHGTKSGQYCSNYTQYYAQVFRDASIKVDIQCHSILHDFAMMTRSPLLISLNASSYSFMAGISKDPQSYISCNMGREDNGKYYLQTEGDWLFDSTAPVLHSDVESYYDFDAVIQKIDR